jgi:hypothetical protein
MALIDSVVADPRRLTRQDLYQAVFASDPMMGPVEKLRRGLRYKWQLERAMKDAHDTEGKYCERVEILMGLIEVARETIQQALWLITASGLNASEWLETLLQDDATYENDELYGFVS